VSKAYSLIVTDASPLITLAVANELDVLLLVGVPVEIPDAVFLARISHRLCEKTDRYRNII
jgi:hypothetical protein